MAHNCKFCENGRMRNGEQGGMKVCSMLEYTYGNSSVHYVRFKYCPMCGRNLSTLIYEEQKTGGVND